MRKRLKYMPLVGQRDKGIALTGKGIHALIRIAVTNRQERKVNQVSSEPAVFERYYGMK